MLRSRPSTPRGEAQDPDRLYQARPGRGRDAGELAWISFDHFTARPAFYGVTPI
jgi:hypothetical protein